ncbi:hypothetical protein A2U01_0088541, partial [Trifolium medium]|nr:hypothetical protein [Trifolium medium]
TLVVNASSASSTSTATARTARPWEAEKEKQVVASKVGMEAVEEGEESEMEGE